MSKFEGNIFELLSDENDDNKAAAAKAAAAKPKKPADAAGAKGAKPKQAPAKGTAAQAQPKKEEPKPKAPAASNKAVGVNQAAAPQQPKQAGGQQQRPRPPKPVNKDAIPVIEAPPGEEGKPNRRNFDNPKGKNRDAGRRALASSQEGRPKAHPFDRKSGTGRPPNEVKRGGAGKFNIGNEKDELAAELDEAKAKEEAAKKEKKEKGAEETTEGPSADTIPEPTTEAAPPAKKELDLSEYQKQQEQSRVALEAALKDFKKADAPKQRAANEGSDDSAWSGYVALKREDEASEPSKKKTTKKAAPKEKPKIEPVFSTDQARKGPKGGKVKGGTGAGKPANKAQTPDVNDKTSFPALSQAPAAAAPAPAPAK